LGELVQVASRFEVVGFQGQGAPGGLDRLDERLFDERIVVGPEGILLDLVISTVSLEPQFVLQTWQHVT
jgi:hypothetical protein